MPASKIIRYDQLSYYDAKLKLFLSNTYATQSSIPTVPSTVSSFTNDAGYQTASDVSTAINTAISGITGITFEIVQVLPATGDPGTIYLILASSGATGDIYDEWIYINNAWEKIGSTAVDLSTYVQYSTTNEEFSMNNTVIAQYASNNDIDALFA